MMGILATMETILCLVEENKEILEKIEPVIYSCIKNIFTQYCASMGLYKSKITPLGSIVRGLIFTHFLRFLKSFKFGFLLNIIK